MDINEFDPMDEAWDGTTAYKNETETETETPAWHKAALYAMPTAARVIREAVTGPEVAPPDPRLTIMSEALALAALSTWMPDTETATLTAKPDDITAVIMTATAAMMAHWVMVGESESGILVNTYHSPAYAPLPDAVFCRPLMQETADEIPAGTTLNEIARMLDDDAPGLGQWRRALAVITPQAKAA